MKTQRAARNSGGRLEGRLFVLDGQLCMVVEVIAATGMARVSGRLNGEQKVLEVPVTEVTRRIATGGNVVLDNLSDERSLAARLIRKDDGWFFQAREGLQGPYQSDVEAQRDLGDYILASQSAR